MTDQTNKGFADLGLSPEVLAAVEAAGYEAPSPIQEAAIPVLLAGKDIIGQAQTGTGKTAAFALPLLSRLDLSLVKPQILVLTPTRELALQVAEAMMTYARGLKGFHVLPVYGGQSMQTQLRRLQRGVHAVVGTPGRIQDHLRRGTLVLDSLQAVVLDEADEMLRMGFLEEVESILEQTPAEKQVALFSATMPSAIARVARHHLRNPVEIAIETRTATVDTIRQRYWKVTGVKKLDALTRILEVEDFDAMLVFVRTKVAAAELAEKIEARGFSSGTLNGDMNQSMRERTVQRLKAGTIDIVVATDVAARGLDVDRITHVVNYDIPYDTEAYIHRVGRTGRAGRTGEAILFVSPRERRMLLSIERATGQLIEKMDLPSREDVADYRITRFKETISETLAEEDLERFETIVRSYVSEQGVELETVAAALAFLAQRDRPLVPGARATGGNDAYQDAGDRSSDRGFGGGHSPRSESRSFNRDDRAPRSTSPRSDRDRASEAGMERFRIEVGRTHDVQPGNIVGAIANEAGLDARHIGQIQLYDNFSTVDLPSGMPKEILRHLSKVWVCGQQLRMRLEDGGEQRAQGGSRRPSPSHAARGGDSASRSGPRGPRKPPGKKPFPGAQVGRSSESGLRDPKDRAEGRSGAAGEGKGRTKSGKKPFHKKFSKSSGPKAPGGKGRKSPGKKPFGKKR
ncbi:MAG: DEAD/DEAH box helicase [Thermoanaerobaculia bacterium]|nr:DEAD/DEAH box helicase [Thermoanaerobaculia bacterium]